MTYAVDWTLTANCLSLYVYLCVYRPDMTYAVDWTLQSNYLSMSISIYISP